jgi:hypothetical protein
MYIAYMMNLCPCTLHLSNLPIIIPCHHSFLHRRTHIYNGEPNQAAPT